MNAELQQEILSLIQGAKGAIPEAVEQWLQLQLWISSIAAFCATAVLLTCAALLLKAFSKTPDGYTNISESDNWQIATIFSVVAGALSAFFLVIAVFNIIAIVYMPEAYIIDAFKPQ